MNFPRTNFSRLNSNILEMHERFGETTGKFGSLQGLVSTPLSSCQGHPTYYPHHGHEKDLCLPTCRFCDRCDVRDDFCFLSKWKPGHQRGGRF